MVQHVLPKGFKRIRYYGVQATKTFAKVKAVIHAALAKVEGVGKGAVKIIARLTYRQRYEQSTGRDPFRCPHCGAEMAVWRIWHPKYGVIYDEGEVIKRGTYTSTAQRAGPCRQADIPQVRPEGVMCLLALPTNLLWNISGIQIISSLFVKQRRCYLGDHSVFNLKQMMIMERLQSRRSSPL
jgi:hypothetical protein